MKIYFISFATHNYGGALQNQKRLAQQAVEVGNVDGTKLFRETDIPHFFRQATELFKDVELVYPRLRHSKYFVWKPQVIIKMLHSIRRDDIVIYHDAGHATIIRLIYH